MIGGSDNESPWLAPSHNLSRFDWKGGDVDVTEID